MESLALLSLLTTNEIAAHESHGQILGVFVLAEPDGVVLVVKVIPEVGNGNT